MFSGLGLFAGVSVFTAILILFFSVWAIVWKGFALWIAVKEEKKWWFIAILIFNTVGILEIVYIFAFSDAGKKYIQGFKKYRAHKKHPTKHPTKHRKKDSEEKISEQ